MRGINHIILNGQVIIQKLIRILIIGQYASYPGGGQNNGIRLFPLYKMRRFFLVSKVQFTARPGDNIRIIVIAENVKDSRSYHPLVTSNVNFSIFHIYFASDY